MFEKFREDTYFQIRNSKRALRLLGSYFQRLKHETGLKIASCGYQGLKGGKIWQGTPDWSNFEGNRGGPHFEL